MSEIYGWITPSHNIIYCGFQDHLSLIQNEEFQVYFPEIKTADDWTAKEYDMYVEDSHEFERNLEPGEHPGWHNFYERKMSDLLRNEGFYRFGTYTTSAGNRNIEIEGNLSSNRSFWRDFIKKNFVVDQIVFRDSMYRRNTIKI